MTDTRPGDIFQPGDLLNNTYRIEAILGRGGTSEVYRARSEISGRIVALKALKSEFSSNEDFLVLMTREEEIRDVRHDAVVRYYDNQRMPDGVVYLVMDFVDGTPLDQKLLAGGMSADDLLVIGARVCEGLIAAHDANIVHRDLSPDNIILRGDKPSEAVIIDFGIAKDTNPGAETIVGNEFAGKYAYAAPEQLNGDTDARSDLYSLGALLLSTFRGAKPDIGRNPMEILQRKVEPLDVSGVPQPLADIIARLSNPIPEERYQSAHQALAAFQGGGSLAPAPIADPPDDATVVAPLSRKASSSPTPAEPRKSRSLLPVIAFAVLIGGGVAAYFGGFLDAIIGPSVPVADPYTLVVEKSEGGVPNAAGHVPSAEVLAAIEGAVATDGGMSELMVATGDIPQDWGLNVLALLETVAPLDAYRIAVTDADVTITGLANDKSIHQVVSDALAVGMPESLNGVIEILQGPLIVSPQSLELVLADSADCGPLSLVSPPVTGYGLDDKIIVTGKLAAPQTRIALFDALSAISGDRSVTIDAEVLSPALCLIETALPETPSGGFDVVFGFGDRAETNPSGRYFVGENPVIDIAVPGDVTDGFLWVSVLDVSGNVFHLMPNVSRPDNSVSALRNGQDGAIAIRVAYSLAEAQDNDRLAFLVDDSTLGKSKIIVLHSDAPLFDGIRPTTESAESYADALRAVADTGALQIRALDGAILTTAAK